MLERGVLKNKRRVWSVIPNQERVALGLCSRLARSNPKYFADKLKNPVFIIGFNNGGKSTLLNALLQQVSFCKYPDEGNAELWFRGFFPWIEAQPKVTPIWYDPELFIKEVINSRDDDFVQTKAYLGAYQWLMGNDGIINDSGMLGALLPDIVSLFPGARFIHIVRDGRVASYLSARKEWSNMMRSPAKYQSVGCDLEFDSVLKRMARYWGWTVNRISTLSVFTDNYLEIRYEDWCSEPNIVLDRAKSFLGAGDSEVPFEFSQNIINMNPIIFSDLTDRDKDIFKSEIGEELSQKGYSWSD